MFVTVSYSYAWPSIRLQWLTESVPGDEWDFYLLALLILEDIPTFRFYSAWIDLKTYKQCRQLQWDHQSPILVGTNWVLKSLAQLGQYLMSLPRLNNLLHYFATPLVSPFSTERLVYLLIWAVPTNRNPIHRLGLTQSAMEIGDPIATDDIACTFLNQFKQSKICTAFSHILQ
jgi:hypothetical protein